MNSAESFQPKLLHPKPSHENDARSSLINSRKEGKDKLSPLSTVQQLYNYLGLEWPATRLLKIKDADDLVESRLHYFNFERSRSQLVTPADGDCTMHSLCDQLR